MPLTIQHVLQWYKKYILNNLSMSLKQNLMATIIAIPEPHSAGCQYSGEHIPTGKISLQEGKEKETETERLQKLEPVIRIRNKEMQMSHKWNVKKKKKDVKGIADNQKFFTCEGTYCYISVKKSEYHKCNHIFSCVTCEINDISVWGWQCKKCNYNDLHIKDIIMSSL